MPELLVLAVQLGRAAWYPTVGKIIHVIAYSQHRTLAAITGGFILPSPRERLLLSHGNTLRSLSALPSLA